MRAILIATLMLVHVMPLHGQTLKARFSELFTFGECGSPLCLDVNASVHGDHFNPSVAQGENNLLGFMSGAIGLAIGNIPLTAAASGVTYRFEGGVPVATSVSAGPILGDRAETLGRGRFLTGANLTGINFNDVRGVPLNRLQFFFPHQNVGNAALGDPDWENDVIEVNTNLELGLLVATFYATYGLTDRLDVGVALPIVRASLEGRSQAVFLHLNTGTSPHFFGTDVNRQVVATSETSGTAMGIGDIAARAKFLVARSDLWAISLLGDVRLPTGDEEEFLGAGATWVRALVVGSAQVGQFAPHANMGVLLTSARDRSNRFVASLGFDRLLGEQVTVAGGLASSFQIGENLTPLPEPVVYTAPVVRTLELTEIPERADNFLDAFLGAKILIGSDARVVTNLAVPLAEAGVRPSVLWTVGLERSF